MESDRELLERAAKAFWGAEIDDVCTVEWGEQDECILYTHGDNQDHNGCDRTYRWNPLEENHDAFELAVKLNLTTVYHPVLNQALCRPYWKTNMDAESREDVEEHPDPCAATRRAIVRAAASLALHKP